MEPHVPGSRAEAERWLGIAEKLLAGRDLVGSKTFAIRAKESEPMLEAADQILAVVDTLIAGEKRINNQHDWYSILQVARYTRDSDLIATQYRRFAILLNPHRNRLPFADQAMTLVMEAWSVLSNPARKNLYDNELILSSKLGQAPYKQQHHHEQTHHHQQEQQQQHHYQQKQEPPPHQQEQQPQTHQQEQQHDVRETLRGNDKNVGNEDEIRRNQNENSTFWTACPYCYYIYEYPGVYEDCTLRCQNCRRAYHGAKIQGPTAIVEGKESYYSCWGFFPLGVSAANLQKNKGGDSTWTPFSTMFNCPQSVDGNYVVGENVNFTGQKNVNEGVPKNVNARKSSAPRIYIDDDDIYVEVSEPSEESDEDWGSTRQKKKTKTPKRKGSIPKKAKKPQRENAKNVNGDIRDNLQGGSVMKEVLGVPPDESHAESSSKAASTNAKKQTGNVPKEWGKLDLNVELSNEVEEPPPGMASGNGAASGVEDGIEGIGFFEGLDEFLSSLPILNGVGDDKVKAA